MEYRYNRRTGDKIGIIGLGTSSISGASEKEMLEALELAAENGINYYDLAAGKADVFSAFGKAFENQRQKLIYQVHFGADYTSGSYGWTMDAEKIKRSIEWQLKMLKTDYIDYGFMHCIDEAADFDDFTEGSALNYLLELKKQGVVKHLGMSSHTPKTVELALDEGLLDMLMFSLNPAYDFEKGDEYGRGSVEERFNLYRRCESEGVGISVMKPFSGGQLLNDKTSPFGRAVTEYQCIAYALDKPGVLTVLPGIGSKKHLEHILGYLTAEAQAKDYSEISGFTPAQIEGKCVYCNHCQPCPVGIDVGLVNKYYDLAQAGDLLAVNHYKNLALNAKDCVQCGHCDSRCPFKVKQSERMTEMAQYFK